MSTLNAASTPEPHATSVRVAVALRDGPCSGEALATRLGVSRAAVHKAVDVLRGLGFPVEARSGQGYALGPAPDLLCPESVVPRLHAEALGQPGYVFLPDTDSTNSVASERARAGAPEGLVVVANSQRAGRGRRGRTFVSPAGTGLYFSAVLRPPLPPQQAFRLTLCGALAVQQAVAELGVPARMKWPNDVMVEGRKLCGVLTELSADAERIHQAVVGVGVNVNTPREAFPAELQDVATSVMVEAGAPVSRAALLAAVLHHMTTWYRLSVLDFPRVVEAARRCSHTLGRLVRVRDGDHERLGTAVDLDADGALILRTDQGNIRVVSGDVEPVHAGNSGGP